ncbi:hypothetical protein LWE69_11805 [Paenibacillus sp. UKAQ_18]|nr:hypothetical protein [Paenibacillus sp. UKAQ_18]
MASNYEPIKVVYNSIVEVTVSADGFQSIINTAAFLTLQQAEFLNQSFLMQLESTKDVSQIILTCGLWLTMFSA